MQKGNTSIQRMNGDALNQTPLQFREPFRHFRRAGKGKIQVKLPVFKLAVAFRFGMGPDSAVAHYEKKALDRNTLAAIKEAAERYKSALEGGEGSPEAKIIAENIEDMKIRLQNAENGELQNVVQEKSRGAYVKMLKETIAKREREARRVGGKPAMDIALEVLAEGLLEVGRKNKPE